MILIITICAEPFHCFEFVKPIEEICKKINVKFKTIYYKDLDNTLLGNADKVIICGTSLKDNSFLDDVEKFQWIDEFDKPLLGICGGMHLLSLVFDGVLKKQQEIGLHTIHFDTKMFGLIGDVEVYELHTFYVEPHGFIIYARSKDCPQAIQHPEKPLYGVLFHPEVRNKTFLEEFIQK